MSDRKELFATLMSRLGLGPAPQSLIGGELHDGQGADITLEDPYARLTSVAVRRLRCKACPSGLRECIRCAETLGTGLQCGGPR